ncbi:hypothetical protein CLOM_g23278, partial [Closterium sp. NIES-68]
LEAITGL